MIRRVSTATRRRIGLGVVGCCLGATLALGLAVKLPCASGDWSDGRQYTRYCYSDIEPLLGTEHLAGGRLPYLDACPRSPGECDEYPVLTMYAMRVAAWASGPIGDIAGFFFANVLILSLAALVVVVALYVLVGPRALYVAAAPTLLLYAYINWDLIAVALAAAATVAFFRRRDVAAGVLLGLGAAAKAYPALLVIPFVAERFREREPDRGIHLAWAATGSWLVVNVPFALAAPARWWEFFRFNAARAADWDSLWFIGCHRLTGQLFCTHTRAINVASLVLFVAIVAIVWRWKRRDEPDFPRWALGFPILVAFLLTNKVYSPQYGLWLLPWFALALPELPLFLAFSAADVAVFLTRFAWFARLSNLGGLPIGAFEMAVVARALVLIVCLVLWTVRPVRARSAVAPATAPVTAEAAA
jgi:uncharacterized membrane protein